MGAWGTALFSDDTASDIRGDYRDHVGDGLSGPEATDRILIEWQQSLADPNEGPVIWLALAATQWACGRLEDRIRDKALEVIAIGASLRPWADNPKLLAKRKAVLARLEAQLRSPPPAEKRIPRRFRNHCDWEIGEMIAYRLLSDRWVVLRVIDYHTDKGGTSPICEILDWIGDEIPPGERLKDVPVKNDTRWKGPARFILGRVSERELPRERVRRLGFKLPPAQQRPPRDVQGRQSIWPVSVFLWRFLDEQLAANFELR
jgi:hypothetical protein